MKRTLLVCALAMGACVSEQRSPTSGVISSLKLVLHDPPPDQLGSATAPVTATQATYDVIALDESGNQVVADVSAEVFISFGGVKTGGQSQCGADSTGSKPIEILQLKGGQLLNHTTQLPLAFGSTSVWLDEPVSHATGASPTIYLRNPFVDEVQMPPDPKAPNATFCSAFNNRFVIIDHARPGGKLVVSSLFGNAFSVTDTGSTVGFNNIYLFAFGKPPPYIQPGTILTSISGNYSKFVGFTELNFPLFSALPALDAQGNPILDDTGSPTFAPPDPTLVPKPILLTLADTANTPKLLSASAGIVEYVGIICDPSPPNPNHDPNIQKIDDSWTKFNQFVLDADGTCSSFTNYAAEIPSKIFGTFDPTKLVGQKLDIIGMLQNHSGQNPYLDVSGNIVSCSPQLPCVKGTCIQGECYKNAFNFWTILPRSPADIVSVTPVAM